MGPVFDYCRSQCSSDGVILVVKATHVSMHACWLRIPSSPPPPQYLHTLCHAKSHFHHNQVQRGDCSLINEANTLSPQQ